MLNASGLLGLLGAHGIATLLHLPGDVKVLIGGLAWQSRQASLSLIVGQTLVEKLRRSCWGGARPSILVGQSTGLLLSGQVQGLLLSFLLCGQLSELGAELVLALRLPCGHLLLESRFKLRIEIELLLLHELLLHRLDLRHVLTLFESLLELRG